MKDYAEHTIRLKQILKTVQNLKLKNSHIQAHAAALLMTQEAQLLADSLLKDAMRDTDSLIH